MSDTELYTNDPFTDDDEYLYRPFTRALPPYADVLAALGNPPDVLAAIAALQAQAEIGALLARIPAQYEVEFKGTGEGVKVTIISWRPGIRKWQRSATTRAEALRAAVTEMEIDNGNR